MQVSSPVTAAGPRRIHTVFPILPAGAKPTTQRAVRVGDVSAMLTRDGESAEMRVRLPSDVLIQPGDNIRIPERFF